jgi:hypothetical protein
MRLRISTIAIASAFVVLATAATQASAIVQEYPDPRDATGLTQAGITYKESGVGRAFTWYVDRKATEAHLRGYSLDLGVQSLQNTIDGSVSDPAGELGRDITGIGFLPDPLNMLAIADNQNSRVVIYDRIAPPSPGDPPVDYSTGRSITSPSGLVALGSPTGLAVNTSNGLVYVSADTGPDGFGIVRFHADTGNLAGYATGYAGEPSALAINSDTGTVFAAIDGSGTIQALNSSASDVDPNIADPLLSSATPGDFIALSVEPETNRLFALKPDELDVFSMTTGTLLGTEQNYDFGGVATSISAIDSYQGIALSSQGIPQLASLFGTALPVCTPQAPPNVAPGASLTFTPDCTDTDASTVREFTVTNAQTLGSTAVSGDRSKFTYTAGTAIGQDDIAYRVQTQDGLSVVKHQLVNVATPAASPPATEEPVVRKTTNLQLDSGDVFIKLPGSDKFVKLTEDMLIPMGTIIDATKGKAHLTFDNGDGTTQDGIFWEGVFQVSQGSGTPPITIIKLRDDLVKQAGTARATSALVSASVADSFEAWTSRRRGKKKNGVWGDAKGRFRTSGKGGSASVNGTRWYVADYTYGALFKVARGKVTVDPIRGKNFPLKAGKQKFIWYKR